MSIPYTIEFHFLLIFLSYIGLAVPLVGVNAFATAAPLIDKMVVVR